LDAVKLAGLSDLAWAGHRDGNIHKNDLDGFIKDIEAWIEMPNAGADLQPRRKDGLTEKPGGCKA
jgi:hypothetical protein